MRTWHRRLRHWLHRWLFPSTSCEWCGDGAGQLWIAGPDCDLSVCDRCHEDWIRDLVERNRTDR